MILDIPLESMVYLILNIFNFICFLGYSATKETIYDIIAEYDEDESGGLSFKEFIKVFCNPNTQKESKDEVHKIFRK